MPRTKADVRDRAAYEAAWLHYKLGLSQAEIAQQMGRDKSTVSRWLADASQRGLVSVQLKPPDSEELASCLARAFGLTRALVSVSFPSANWADPEELRAMQLTELGRRAAEVLGRELSQTKTSTGIGLGGGRGIAAFAESLRQHYEGERPLQFHALSISTREPFLTSAATVTSLATYLLTRQAQERSWRERLRGRSKKDAAPEVDGTALRLPSIEMPESLATAVERYYEEASATIQIVLTGIGEIETCYVLDRSRGANEAERVRRRGAVGEILYEFFNEHGVGVTADIAARAYSFGIARLQRLVAAGREVIVICSGKIEPLFHALRSPRRFVTGIVTDERTALELLDMHDARQKGAPSAY